MLLEAWWNSSHWVCGRWSMLYSELNFIHSLFFFIIYTYFFLFFLFICHRSETSFKATSNVLETPSSCELWKPLPQDATVVNILQAFQKRRINSRWINWLKILKYKDITCTRSTTGSIIVEDARAFWRVPWYVWSIPTPFCRHPLPPSKLQG